MKKNIHVVGAVIIENDKILCAQRSAHKTLPLQWEFPGGKIEVNESPEEALKREIKEEMECDIKIGEQVEHTVYEYDFGIVHLTTYYCEILKGEPVLTEHEDVKWLTADQLSSLDWAPADIPAIKAIKNKFKH